MGKDASFSAAEEGKLNDTENTWGAPMSPSEVAKHFNEPTPVPAKTDPLPTTPEEVKVWEAKQDNSNDIYKIAARVKNLARGNGGSLTAVGDILCNTYCHVLKALYDQAEKIPEPHKTAMLDLIKKHEDMPANVISAAGAGVKK